MIKNTIYALILLTAFLLPTGCVNDCTDCDFGPVMPRHSRVLFHYLAMDNDLVSYGRRNVSDMFAGATAENLNGGAIVVFSDMRSDPYSCLIYIYADRKGTTHQDTIYRWDTNLDSSKPETFVDALDKARQLVVTDSWALGAGSHGSGWMPAAMHNKYLRAVTRLRSLMDADVEDEWYIRDPFNGAGTRALLNDGASYMEVSDFADAIPDGLFEFAIMDICYTGGVEFAYAMRNKAKQLILSPAEVIAYGMPYDRIIQYIFADTPVLGSGGVCDVYNDFYAEDFQNGGYFATIALYDCTKMEAFATTMREVLGPMESQMHAMTQTDLGTLQRFDRLYYNLMFDVQELVYKLYPAGNQARTAFDAALAEVVKYKRTSGNALGSLIIPENRFCGISSYVPIAEYDDLNAYYWQTAWGAAVYR